MLDAPTPLGGPRGTVPYMNLYLASSIALLVISVISRWGLAAAAIHDLALLSAELRARRIPEQPPFRGELYAWLGLAHCTSSALIVLLAGLHLFSGPLSLGAIATYVLAAVVAIAAWHGLGSIAWEQCGRFEAEFGATPRAKAAQLWGPGAGAAWPIPSWR